VESADFRQADFERADLLRVGNLVAVRFTASIAECQREPLTIAQTMSVTDRHQEVSRPVIVPNMDKFDPMARQRQVLSTTIRFTRRQIDLLCSPTAIMVHRTFFHHRLLPLVLRQRLQQTKALNPVRVLPAYVRRSSLWDKPHAVTSPAPEMRIASRHDVLATGQVAAIDDRGLPKVPNTRLIGILS
jgi:hypothetical protein